MNYIKVRVRVGQKKEKIEKISEDTFNIEVKEKAKNNMANKRVFEILSDYLSLDKSKIALITGHKSGNKIFSIE